MVVKQTNNGLVKKLKIKTNGHASCKLNHAREKLNNIVPVGNEGDLVQQAVGHCSSDQSLGGGLVWHSTQENVQVILEQGKIPRVLIPEMVWQQVKEAGTMNTQRPLSGLANFARG